MTRESEYMEAFFGVELGAKFSDMVNELKELEVNLKELSQDMAKLSTTMPPDEFQGMLKECRAAAYEFAQQVKDVRQFLEFYLKSDKTATHITLERDAYMKIYQIFKWDGNDVRDLRGWLRDLRDITDKIGLHMEDLVNFQKLTARPVPEDLSRVPVYAIDRHGYCLMGKGYDQVIHVDELREQLAGDTA
ncbi:MAG TPA: hypothetical protein VMB35_05270 [Methanomicrobiales archaeon]|nr:hypothetical protein [Methanomicrobiales archaeon]